MLSLAFSRVDSSETILHNPILCLSSYTTKDSLQYVPLAELLASAAEDKPDLLILCGPFVDINQPDIQGSRLVELTHQEVFYERVVPQLNKFCLTGSPGTRVIMVPSERDVHHDFVFPQPPFSVPRDEVRAFPYVRTGLSF
eukprot:COSAG03_NODE_18_length_21685_cov_15.938988_7_plen_141_part_00